MLRRSFARAEDEKLASVRKAAEMQVEEELLSIHRLSRNCRCMHHGR